MKKFINMKKFILSITVIATLLSSCSKTEQNEEPVNENIKGSFKSTTTNMLINDSIKYANLLDTTISAQSFFLHFNDNPLYLDQYVVFDTDPPMNITADGLQLSSSQSYSSSDFTERFGSLVSFLIGQSDTEFYIPEKIEILKPEISSKEDLLPFCFFEDFELFWNEDVDNDNGILVMVEWTGTMYGENDINNAHIQNIDHIPDDDGTATLNNDLFKDIPEDAICDHKIARGNLGVVEYNGTDKVQVGGFSGSSISFILVRDMSKYNPV